MINYSMLVSEYYLLVVGGNDGNRFENNLDTVELISTKRHLPDRLKSRRLSNFPIKMRAAAGATLGDSSLPLICGGDDGSNHRKECYVYHPQSNRWNVSGQLSEARAFSGSATHPDYGLVIVSGRSDDGYITSAEQTKDGKAFRPFASLPLPLFAPGLVSLGKGGGKGDFFLTGGKTMDGVYSRKAFIYDKGSWSQMANMATARGGNKLAQFSSAILRAFTSALKGGGGNKPENAVSVIACSGSPPQQ